MSSFDPFELRCEILELFADGQELGKERRKLPFEGVRFFKVRSAGTRARTEPKLPIEPLGDKRSAAYLRLLERRRATEQRARVRRQIGILPRPCYICPHCSSKSETHRCPMTA